MYSFYFLPSKYHCIVASYIYFVSNPRLHYVTGSEKTGHLTNDFKAELLLPGCSIDLGQ